MVGGPLGLLCIAVTCVAVLIVLMSGTKHRVSGAVRSAKTPWAWALLVLAVPIGTATVFFIVAVLYPLLGQSTADSSPWVAALMAAALLAPTLTGAGLGICAWRESHAMSALLAVLANSAVASVVVATGVAYAICGVWVAWAGYATFAALGAVTAAVGRRGHHPPGGTPVGTDQRPHLTPTPPARNDQRRPVARRGG